MPDASSFFRQIPRRSSVISAHRAEGGKLAAVFPIHYPRALFHAFDVLPVEVWGPPGIDTARGDAHLQAYTCSIVRGGLSFLLSGGLDVADVLLVPHACDSLQGLGSVLRDFVDLRSHLLTLYCPRGPERASVEFLTAELDRLFGELCRITGKRPEEADLLAAIERDERADAALSNLLSARRYVDVDDRAFYRLVRSREYLPPEQFRSLAEEALALRSDVAREGTGVVLSGIVPEPMEILDTLSSSGAIVVADDLACAGRRLYPAGKSDRPLVRMAERLVAGPPDSTRGSSVRARVEHIERLARSGGAKIVLFYVVKFCEPELFYLPQLRAALSTAGLSSVVIEGDVTDPLPHQAVTRIEALMETAS